MDLKNLELSDVATHIEKIMHFQKIAKFIKFGIKSTHFENFCKVRLIWDQHYKCTRFDILKNCVKSV